VDYWEPPWVTEIRRQLDKEWAAYLRFLQQRDCRHAAISEGYDIDASQFDGMPVFFKVPPRCLECGKEMTDGKA
jgi:hypothetical protein